MYFLCDMHDDHYQILQCLPHYSILLHVWRVSLDTMDKCVLKSSAKKGTNITHLHQRLFTALQTMRDFFYCEGEGLSDKELDSEKYNVTDTVTWPLVASCTRGKELCRLVFAVWYCTFFSSFGSCMWLLLNHALGGWETMSVIEKRRWCFDGALSL